MERTGARSPLCYLKRSSRTRTSPEADGDRAPKSLSLASTPYRVRRSDAISTTEGVVGKKSSHVLRRREAETEESDEVSSVS